MFINKFHYKKIPYRNYKSLKFLYKSNKIKKLLHNNFFILFFYYNNLFIHIEKQLKLILNKENLQYWKINASILNEITFFTNTNNFKNLLKNNICLIYSTTNQEYNNKFLTNLLVIKNLYFLGIWLEKKIFRPSEILKLNFLQKNLPLKFTSKLIFLKILKFKNTLSLKKNSFI